MDSFVKFYGRRKPQDAAGVYFQMGEVYEKDKKYDDLARHLENYLKKWGKEGGPDRQIQAHFRLGEMAWKASCAKAAEDGACLEVKRVAATGRQKVIADLNKKLKKGKKIKEVEGPSAVRPPSRRSSCSTATSSRPPRAQDHFQTVIKIWKGGDAASKITGKDVEARAGGGRLRGGRRGLPHRREAVRGLPQIKFPEGLDFQQPSQYDSKRKQTPRRRRWRSR